FDVLAAGGEILDLERTGVEGAGGGHVRAGRIDGDFGDGGVGNGRDVEEIPGRGEGRCAAAAGVGVEADRERIGAHDSHEDSAGNIEGRAERDDAGNAGKLVAGL